MCYRTALMCRMKQFFFFFDKSQNEAVMCIHVEIVDMTYELIEVGN